MITKVPSEEARIETTNFCNANCTICTRSTMTRAMWRMSYSYFGGLLPQLQKVGITKLSLFGFGEPLLDTRLQAKIKRAKQRNMETTITTNASLLDHNRAILIFFSGLNHIRFSVHGLYKDTYEAVHRGLKWRDVMANIFHFIWLNDHEFDHRIKTEVTVIPQHGETVDEIRRFWEPLVDVLEIWRPHNWGGLKNFRKVVRKKRTCGRPENGPLQIMCDGRVIPCCFLTNGEVILGNVHKRKVIEILNSEEYEKLREAHRTGNLSGYPCENCDQLNEYTEEDYPLLYSSIDPSRKIGTTSITKFNLEG